MSKLATLLGKDARGIARDSLLAPLAFYPLLIALVTRFAVGWFPIEHLDVYLAPAAVVIAPVLMATIFGFALIEERENETWLLLRVLPLPQTTLLVYLVATTSGFSLVVSLLSALVYGLRPADWTAFLALTVTASLLAPLISFLLGTVADNKIVGFAVAKILGAVPMLPALIFLLPPGWQLLLFWNPYYWVYLGLLRAFAGERIAELAVHWPPYPDWIYVVATLAISLTGIWLFGAAYRRAAA